MGSLTGDGDIHRRVNLAHQDTVPDGLQLRIDAEVVESMFRGAHPACLRITTTNEGGRRALSVGTGKCRLFNREASTSTSSGLILHAPESSQHIERETNRWVRDAPAETARVFRGCSSPVNQ